MNKKHVNIPIFIPHLGCPNNCVFCNQRTISGVSEFNPNDIVNIIEDSLSTTASDDDVEIAFFGGSFTGIDRDLMIKLLNEANEYIKQGRITSIRCSTRPDYINDEILDILSSYGVKTVELGLQSSSDRVLDITKRGHSFLDEVVACAKIKEHGMHLGGQMMIGLPGATLEDEINTAKFILDAGANEARIYPTIVFKDTELATMLDGGSYAPISLEEAVARSAEVFKIFIDNGIKVLRIGLCDSENLHSDKTYYAGPNHAAMGELVEGRYYYNLISKRLKSMDFSENASLIIEVAKGHTSKVIGQSKINKNSLIRKFKLSDIKVKESTALSEYKVNLAVRERKQNVFKVT